MHIAYLTAEYPHPSMPPAGGIGSFVKTMGHTLTSLGHEVTVFLCVTAEDKEWFDGKVRIVQIKQEKNKISFLTNRFYINSIVKRYIDKYKINLVEAPDWEGLHAFCRLPVPVITRINGSVTYFNHIEGGRFSRVMYFLERKALNLSKSIIAASDFSGQKTIKIFKLKNHLVQTIYNGVDISKFEPGNKPGGSKPVVLYFGTLVRKKGVLEIPLTFNKLMELNPNLELVLIGRDTVDYKEQKSTWAMMQQLFTPQALANVRYIGAIAYDQIKEHIAACTVCIFPSYAEAFPIAWLEAMAMEKPVVASNIGWGKESIEDGISGFLVHPANHHQFAARVNEIIEDTVLAEKLGKNARLRVQHLYSQNVLIPQNLSYYSKIINEQ